MAQASGEACFSALGYVRQWHESHVGHSGEKLDSSECSGWGLGVGVGIPLKNPAKPPRSNGFLHDLFRMLPSTKPCLQ